MEYPYHGILISNKNEETAANMVADSLHESHRHSVGEEARYNATDGKPWSVADLWRGKLSQWLLWSRGG